MSKKVTLYSKPNCGHCVMTKNWLIGNDTDVEVIDVTKDKDALNHVMSLGFKGVPVTEIEGHKPFDAFRPDLLDEYLNK